LCVERALEAVEDALEPVEAPFDAAPAGRDELHKEREVLDACLALGHEVSLETFESADRLRGETADLGEMLRDGNDLIAKSLLDGRVEPLGHPRLELRGRDGERFETGVRTLEESLECGLVGPAIASVGEADSGSVDCVAIHGRSLVFVTDVGMRASELDYELPPELIAQRPLDRRDESRLLVFDRAAGAIEHATFTDLPSLVPPETLVVVNDTRVLPARLKLTRGGGGAAEVLLLERLEEDLWEALARPSRKLKPGMRLGEVEFVESLGEGRWRVRVEGEPAGAPPLPPYITEALEDPDRYQTVYADELGSAAAPTAGLHFTPELLGRLDVERITLHVGLDTFRPITAEWLSEHELHSERYAVAPAVWGRIEAAAHATAVGTTTVRVLESLARGGPLTGRTSLFVTPGFEFGRVDALVTNFHLPRSSLLALVMAFAGVEETRELYRLAIEKRYRFYSFGDAMLVR
jgi:S-adenosylmethionine:tRNA ribosyltransferase-isomerase